MSRPQEVYSSPRGSVWACLALCFLFGAVFDGVSLTAQTATGQPGQNGLNPDSRSMADIEHRLNDVTATLSQTQQALQQSYLILGSTKAVSTVELLAASDL